MTAVKDRRTICRGRGPRPTRSYRALNRLSTADIRLLALVARPEFGISGLRNRDLRAELFQGEPADDAVVRHKPVAECRCFVRMEFWKRPPKSHGNRVTDSGRQALTALLAAANATTNELTTLAA